MNDSFEPQILAYCCKYCAYAAADLNRDVRMGSRDTLDHAGVAGLTREGTVQIDQVQSRSSGEAPLATLTDLRTDTAWP